MENVSRETRDLLSESLLSLRLNPSENQIDSLLRYMILLQKWNEVKNITAITSDREIVLKHFIDSLSIVQGVSFGKEKVIDIGTGAGIPGIPIKIMFPELHMTFVDSSKGKIEIVDKMCQELGLSNYNVIADNIESLGQNPIHREAYDLCLSRALAALNILLEYSAPLVKNGGLLGLYKGPNYQEEVENSQTAMNLLGCKILKYIDFSLPLLDEKRTIIVVEKIGITPQKYPRRVGIPRKRPL